MRSHTPMRRLISRHTRELLRRYAAAGMLSTPIAGRQVRDRFVDMSEAERDLYAAVEEYISKDLQAGLQRGTVGGRFRDDDLPAAARQQLRGPARDVREAPRHGAARDCCVGGP